MHRIKKKKKKGKGEERQCRNEKCADTSREEARPGQLARGGHIPSPGQPCPQPLAGRFPSYSAHLPLLTPLVPLPPPCLSLGLQLGIFGGEQTAEQGEGTGPSTGTPAVAPGGRGRGRGAAGRRGLGALGLLRLCSIYLSKSPPPHPHHPPARPRLSSFLKLHHFSVLGGRTFRNSKAKDLGRVEVFSISVTFNGYFFGN